MNKEILIGCDNAGVSLKKIIILLLEKDGYTFEDIGVHSEGDPTNYPLVAQQLSEKIISSGYTREGILICGTGIGMAITANKFSGIYAAVCHDIFSTERARLSNNVNVVCFGARVIGPELARRLVNEWLTLKFQGGPSQKKLDVIKKIEQNNFLKLAEPV